MNVPSWVVVLCMVGNGMMAASLNFKVLCPPESAQFAMVSVLLAGLGVVLGLSKSPMKAGRSVVDGGTALDHGYTSSEPTTKPGGES